jgi:predicted kinase
MGKLSCKIMRGCSGSGKSTYAKTLFPKADILSTDDFWINSETGAYEFDVARHSEAHAWNLRRFVDAIRYWAEVRSDGENADMTIVVDNTNTTPAEFAPYAAIANAYGFDVEIVTLDVDPAIAGPRNVHSVPTKIVEGQYRNLMFGTKAIPKWWKSTIIKEVVGG